MEDFKYHNDEALTLLIGARDEDGVYLGVKPDSEPYFTGLTIPHEDLVKVAGGLLSHTPDNISAVVVNLDDIHVHAVGGLAQATHFTAGIANTAVEARVGSDTPESLLQKAANYIALAEQMRRHEEVELQRQRDAARQQVCMEIGASWVPSPTETPFLKAVDLIIDLRKDLALTQNPFQP